ncbi:AMP-binding protein [Actinomadura chibensis]|uniref:AMP-binding protein n=1 Tax=Actinomadura chibensis TaxID=392828 RepID=A0A5D0NKT4_9ACTN|nr:AMP-binding protein [Actinomadura chibensis]TYB44858.1 AMP-binding protein [Actinomadura chibensis]
MGVEGVGFYEIARNYPDRPAVLAPGVPVSYGELHAEVNRLSNALDDLGLRPGDTLATVLGNRAEFLTVLLAAMQSGLYLVPVSRHLTGPEIGYILRDCGAKVVVTESAFAEAVASAADDAGVPEAGRVSVDPVRGYRLMAGLCASGSAHPPAKRQMGSIMLYTSGTTGRPKGVRRPLLDITPEILADVMRQTLMRHLGLAPGDDVHLAIGPLYHSAPCVHAMMALYLGHAVVVASRFRPEHTLALIQRHRVTNTFMVPTMFHRMLALPDEVRERYDVSSLRQVFHSAAPVPVETKRRMMDWWGPVLYEYYGSTESGPVTIASPEEWLAHPGTVGSPVEGVQIKILDPEGAELPAGETGLIYASGHPGFEYHGDPAKTASAMRGDFYTAGDLGRVDADGRLYMSDRRTDLIISGGVNIYPAEVENVLLQHPAVGDAAVIGVPDDEWGQSVVALVEPAEDDRPGGLDERALEAELLAFCAPRLARMKHPRRVEFRAALPRTPSGKLSRGRLREDYLRG